MRKLRLFAIIVLAIGITANAFSQSLVTYEKTPVYPSPLLYYYTGNHVMEMSDNSILFTQSFSNMEESQYQDTVGCHGINFIKISQNGELIDTMYYEFQHDYSIDNVMSSLLRDPLDENGNMYIYFTINDTCFYNALFFDNDLNITNEIRTPLDNSNNYWFSRSMLDPNNNFIRIWEIEDKIYKVVIVDIYGEIIKSSILNLNDHDGDFQMPFDPFFIYNENPLQYGLHFSITYLDGLVTLGHDEIIIVLDEELNVVDQKIFSGGDKYVITQDGHSTNVVKCDDGNMALIDILATDDHYLTLGSLKLCKIDNDMNIVDECSILDFTYTFQDMNIFKNEKSLVKCEDGSMYCLWVSPMNPDADLSKYRLHVTRVDKDMNIQWERTYHENCHYINQVTESTALENGGLAIICDNFYSSWNMSPSSTSVFILQHDGTSVAENTSMFRPYSFYPNPADDNINIRFSPDINCEKVEIYGIDGKLYHEQNFNMENINVSNLSNGIYMMKVTLDNGNTYTEKVVIK